MVDAVDEHWDSFIRVQTIRDLLIIWSFVRRLQLKDLTEWKVTEDDFIENIHSVFWKNSFNWIEVLMNSCTKQFVWIKHLHSELSNREEASKIKAKEISKWSKFEFMFNPQRDCYEVICFYWKSNKKMVFRDLCDLRDRVLLLIYNEKEQKEEAAKDVVWLNKKVSWIINDDDWQPWLMKKHSKAIHTNIKEKDNQKHVVIKSLRDILAAFIKSIEISEKILFVM